MSFKDPSFQDRIGSAAKARQKALDQLRSKPPLDEKVVAERQAAKDAEAAAKAVVPPPPTEAERKAARDARYAARKARK